MRIRIPALKVNAPIIPAAVDSAGALVVPANVYQAAWFQAGNAPGQPGTAIIAAHVDFEGALGLFNGLHTLPKGAAIYVTDASGHVRRLSRHFRHAGAQERSEHGGVACGRGGASRPAAARLDHLRRRPERRQAQLLRQLRAARRPMSRNGGLRGRVTSDCAKAPVFQGAISSGGERFPDTEEVVGSNPTSPTRITAGQRPVVDHDGGLFGALATSARVEHRCAGADCVASCPQLRALRATCVVHPG